LAFFGPLLSLFLSSDDSQDDETKQDDSKGRKTNKQSHVDVDVTITNKNKSTKASTKEASSTKGNINKPESAKDYKELI
jgi:hypothetical protein